MISLNIIKSTKNIKNNTFIKINVRISFKKNNFLNRKNQKKKNLKTKVINNKMNFRMNK